MEYHILIVQEIGVYKIDMVRYDVIIDINKIKVGKILSVRNTANSFSLYTASGIKVFFQLDGTKTVSALRSYKVNVLKWNGIGGAIEVKLITEVKL